jgi:hypothetical protein
LRGQLADADQRPYGHSEPNGYSHAYSDAQSFPDDHARL